MRGYAWGVETRSPALKAFLRSYKRRRLGARLAWALFAVMGLAWYSYGRWQRRYSTAAVDNEYKLAWLWLASLFGVLSTWLFARCPECRRYIGVGRRARADFTASPPCELEQACAEELAAADSD